MGPCRGAGGSARPVAHVFLDGRAGLAGAAPEGLPKSKEATETVRRRKLSRGEILRGAAKTPCTCAQENPGGHEGMCYDLLKDCLDKNKLDGIFQRHVAMALREGRGKSSDVSSTAPSGRPGSTGAANGAIYKAGAGSPKNSLAPLLWSAARTLAAPEVCQLALGPSATPQAQAAAKAGHPRVRRSGRKRRPGALQHPV